MDTTTKGQGLIRGNDDFILEIDNEEDDEPLMFKEAVIDDASLREINIAPGIAVNGVLGVFNLTI
jgi:hypothetical protein